MKDTRIYKKTKYCAASVDIYDIGNNSPVLIYIHGGGLILGSRSWLRPEQIEYYNDAGFSVVSIDYRLAPETKLEFIVEDVRDAIDWVRTTATQWYGFDPNRFALVGSSAGAYLSLLMGTMDVKPAAIVSFYGYGDILGEWYAKPSDFYCQKPLVTESKGSLLVSNLEITDGPWERFHYYLYCRQHGAWVNKVTGYDRIYDLDQLRKYNPIDHVSGEYPPTLFLHGDKDTDVPYEQSVMMYNKLKEMGVQTGLITIQDGDHGFDQYFGQSQVRQAFEKVIHFLHANMDK